MNAKPSPVTMETVIRWHRNQAEKLVGFPDGKFHGRCAEAIDAHLSLSTERAGWQFYHAGQWRLTESDEPWRSKGMPVREVFALRGDAA